MSLTLNFWEIKNGELIPLNKTKLDTEQRLEDWIVKYPDILGIDLLLLGRQVTTEFGGRIDLFGINIEGDLIIIELKKDQTPREVVAQILDYASWIKNLTYAEINLITQKYSDKTLSELYRNNYNQSLPENINTKHSMIIVAAQLDDSSERIVEYLSEEYDIDINAIYFNYFKEDNQEFIGRAWLMDPESVKDRSDSRKYVPWTGYWFINVGEGEYRNWDDNRKYNFISAGQGQKYSGPLKKLKIGDKIFAYMKGLGYVGYGEVTRETTPINEFEINGNKIINKPLKAPKATENSDDIDMSEWLVGIKWYKTFNRNNAQFFKHIFANQNIVCKLRDQQTIEFLLDKFEVNR